jgi:hypothetical protein
MLHLAQTICECYKHFFPAQTMYLFNKIGGIHKHMWYFVLCCQTFLLNTCPVRSGNRPKICPTHSRATSTSISATFDIPENCPAYVPCAYVYR